jgi:long-subunit acyl-CoA synthetase (AMP-forming)
VAPPRRADLRSAGTVQAAGTVGASGAGHTGRGPRPVSYLAWGLYDLLVYRRIRAELGGRLRYAIQRRIPAGPSTAEAIRRFLIVDGDFTEENGLLTPSLKVKRQEVMAVYAREVEELYRR